MKGVATATGERRWLPFVALGVGSLLIAGGVAQWTTVAQSFLVLGAGALLLGAGFGLAPLIRQKRDPYDLGKLSQLQDQIEIKAAEATHIEEGAQVVCPNCFEPYSAKFPVCPRCKRLG